MGDTDAPDSGGRPAYPLEERGRPITISQSICP